jgi:hypothetical protein
MKYLKLYEQFRLVEENDESLPGVDIPSSQNTSNLVLMEDRGKDKNILIVPGTGEGDAGFASDYGVLFFAMVVQKYTKSHQIRGFLYNYCTKI